MNDSFLSFSMPELGDEEIADVVSVLKSGWITTGAKAKQFEDDFAAFIGGSTEALAVSSATAGLHLALEAIGVGPEDEVITTTHTFTATAEVIRYLGADPVFVDIDPDTLCIDISSIEAAISPRTKAIIPVHFGGFAVDMKALLTIAKKYRLFVVEDAAHALPTTSGGEIVGSLDSDATVFSFYANKTITTGEGGMLVTRNAEIAKRARLMRLHGIDRDAFNRFRSTKPSWFYEIVAPGYKYNMTDIAAAIGINQLRKARTFQDKRHRIACVYDQSFSDLPVVLPPRSSSDDTHSWHLYVIRLADHLKLSRDEFINKMYEAGIGCSVHYVPLHLQPYWRDTYHLTPDMFPHSQHAYEQSISLPIYSRMSDTDIHKVVSTVREILLNA